MRQFYQIDAYESPQVRYHLLPFRFLRIDPDGRELLVTDAGEYEIVPAGITSDLVRGRVERHWEARRAREDPLWCGTDENARCGRPSSASCREP